MELAIDTSTRYAAVGLSQGGEPLAELTWRSERNHTMELMPSVQRLLAGAGVQVRDLGAVFTAIGPGGFSALRVGMSTAKGMAEALDIPLVGVGTLEVEAFPYADTGRPVCPILEAGRSEVAWGLFQQEEDCWRRLRPGQITSVEELCAELPAGAILCGEGLWTARPRLLPDALERAVVIALPPPTRRASVLARLGAQRLAEGRVDDRASLQPLYLRSPSITPPKDPGQRSVQKISGDISQGGTR